MNLTAARTCRRKSATTTYGAYDQSYHFHPVYHFPRVQLRFFFVLALTIRIVSQWFDKRLVILHMFTSFWASLYLWVMPAWSVTVAGREKIRRQAQYIIVSNHQSQLDILVAFRLFFPFKWVSKAEVFRLPFIGWNMYLNRYIGLKRGDRESIRQMMQACERALDAGCSLYFFPEGTRSRTGQMKPFKPGAFILAKQTQVPILPVIIDGTRAALPKYSLNFHGRHPIRIKVLDVIPPSDFTDLTIAQLSEMVRARIAAQLNISPENSAR